jgi:predicted NUDIX family NTP pyrophosphohydrolase
MGGPFWARKDAQSWSVIKGLLEPGEEPLEAALREFGEETGSPLATPGLLELLGAFRQPSGKLVTVFVAEIDSLPPFAAGSTFDLEWPPRSGRLQSFPEIDAARWLTLPEAGTKLVRGQLPVLQALQVYRQGVPD